MAISRCVMSRYTTAWAESQERAVNGRQSWAILSRYRCRLLPAEIPKGCQSNEELNRRLQLWEAREVHELRVLGPQRTAQQAATKRKRSPKLKSSEESALVL